MKEKYIKIKMEIIEFDTEDVIATSSTEPTPEDLNPTNEGGGYFTF